MNKRIFFLLSMIVFAICIIGYPPIFISADYKVNKEVDNKVVTIPVTVHATNSRMRAIVDQLQPSDFIVTENKQPQEILDVKRPTETPIILSILIQDNLESHVGNEIKGIKQFIQNLPEGSQVMTGYISAGFLQVAQPFTADRTQAAQSLRIPMSSPSAVPYSSYLQLLDAICLFDNKLDTRRIILFISDGLDMSQELRGGNMAFSIYLEQAIKIAQQKGIAIYSFYTPTADLHSNRLIGNYRQNLSKRLAINYGQSALNRLSRETGGTAYFTGSDFVTFDNYFKDMNELINHQWIITYRSSNINNSFRHIKVKTDFDLHLHYPNGYYPK